MAIETKREKFVRLAERRTSNAVKAIRAIGNLATPANYEYSPTDSRKIQSALQAELDALKHRFASNRENSDFEFKL